MIAIKRVEEVAIVDNGITFFSSKSRLIFGSIIFILSFIGGLFSIWVWEPYLIFTFIGVSLLSMEIAIASYCAVNDKTLYVMQTMPLKYIREIRVKQKGKSYAVTINYNGAEFKQNFSIEGYEYIRLAKKNKSNLSK